MADQDPGYSSESGLSKDHSSKVWNLAQRFQRIRLKCELWTDDGRQTTDGRQVMRKAHMAF